MNKGRKSLLRAIDQGCNKNQEETTIAVLKRKPLTLLPPSNKMLTVDVPTAKDQKCILSKTSTENICTMNQFANLFTTSNIPLDRKRKATPISTGKKEVQRVKSKDTDSSNANDAKRQFEFVKIWSTFQSKLPKIADEGGKLLRDVCGKHY